MESSHDAVLFVSFGGPEGMEEVRPFLDNVLRGRNVPPQRVEEVARHYERFGGVSPINEQTRRLIAAVSEDFRQNSLLLPIYWGNRNWHPMLEDTVRSMKADGVQRALAFVTSAFGSYSSCRQYLEDIETARKLVGAGAPEIEKLRLYFNHPRFIDSSAGNLAGALAELDEGRRRSAEVVFTAHSIPVAMAEVCLYEEQLRSACRLVVEAAGEGLSWRLVFQSRSGPPGQPWLEPDVCDYIEQAAARGVGDIVILPIGFICDHMEIMFDIETEARSVAARKGVNLIRVPTVGVHPLFVPLVRELVLERTAGAAPRSLGEMGLLPDQCSSDCCRYSTGARK